jgi:hypothetical protein
MSRVRATSRRSEPRRVLAARQPDPAPVGPYGIPQQRPGQASDQRAAPLTCGYGGESSPVPEGAERGPVA